MTVVNLISLGLNKILISYNDSPRTPVYPDRLCFLGFCFLILLHRQSQFTQILEANINVQVSVSKSA